MIRAVVFGRELRMQGSPYTLIVYRREFDGDLLQSVVGAYQETPPDMTTLMQVAWAMCKTHDEGTSGFVEWIKEFDVGRFTLGDPETIGVIDSAINAELFREQKAGGFKRRVGRLLDSLAQRIGDAAHRLLAR